MKKTIEKILIDITGWAGSVFVLAAYGLLSTHKLKANSKIYQILNIAGSVCLIFNTFFYSAYPSTFVNIVWLAIAIYALYNIYKSSENTD
ncbi:MAG: hypothetical protein IT280_05880 [Ignavibacteria bacterium]|nr:hypothetical protein [Ignavibacteria bacterium]